MPEHEDTDAVRGAIPASWRAVGNALAAIWIVGGMVFFLVRFAAVFYRANQDAIDRLLERL